MTKAQKRKYIRMGLYAAFAIIIVVALLLLFVFNKSKKLVCKAPEGEITLKYNDDTILGYTSLNLSFDLDEAKKYVEEIGIDKYIEDFKVWFETNSTGKCE